MKATDSALNAYQTTKSLDTLRKAEYGLYGITSANGLGEYVTGQDMFGNELSEEQRERSLNEALALLGGNASPTVNFGQVSRSNVLLPTEGRVGTFKELAKQGTAFDNITPHHMPSAAKMKREGIKRTEGVSMNMEPPHPGSGGRHRATYTYGLNGSKLDEYLKLSYRDALALDIIDARRIYKNDNVYTPEIRKGLKDVIQKNKDLYPELFKNK